jgi:hypothetical protein
MSKPLAFSLLASVVLTAQAACPSWPTSERFTLSGAEATDKRTGLTWKRCSEGQAWSGNTCTGSASFHTHEAALTLAQAANTTQNTTGWRLPNVKELASLADKGCGFPAIDNTAFPATHNDNYWSSSPNAGISSSAWVVGFGSGGVDSNTRGGGNAVRLVRASQ